MSGTSRPQASTNHHSTGEATPRRLTLASRHPLASLLRQWRNTIVSLLLLMAGLGTTVVTVLARRAEDVLLVNIAAVASLVIVALIIVLVVPSLARSASAELAGFDLPLHLTRGGALFVAMTAVVAFAAWNTGNNLLFVILSVLLSTLFVAWAAARASLRDLVVTARFPDHIFAGEAAPAIIVLRNRKRLLPSFSIRIDARIAAPQKAGGRRRTRFALRPLAYFVYVAHRSAAEQRVEQVFTERGHVLIKGFEISTRFPFGFFRLRRRLRTRDVDVIVYPKLEPVGDELHLLPMNAGQVISTRRGAGHDLLALRDYQPQDNPRHIDWKATARSRRLTVREFAAEDERRITVKLDLSLRHNGGEPVSPERFERGVTLAASLVAHFIAERADVRLVLGDEGGRNGAGPEHLYECLRRLAVVTPITDATGDTPAIAATPTQATAHQLHDSFVILLTTAPRGSIPASVWRSSHVIYL